MLNSIRTRLTLWYLSVLALIIIVFAGATYLLVAHNLSQTTDNNLDEIVRNIQINLDKEDADLAVERLLPSTSTEKDEDEKKPADGSEEAPLTIEQVIAEELDDLRSRDYGFVVIGGNGQIISSTVTNPQLEEGTRNLASDISFADVLTENETFRVHQITLSLDGKPFRLLITRSLSEQIAFLDNLKRIFYISVPFALIMAGLSGYFLARRSLAPVVSMSDQAARIGASTLNERLTVRNENDELGSLAKVFNSLLSRLDTSFERQKRFMADASHELRTPLAIVRGESEVALSKDNRSAADYRESLAIVHDESKRLTLIVEDLFILARADSGELKPRLAALYLDEILVECVRAVGSLAEKRNVKVEFCSPGEMPSTGDETLLHRLFLNLLDNAIKYNRENGTVTVEAENEGDNYSVTIGDTGEGIATEDHAKIFDRFYRVDKSRSRDNTNGKNGVGLGLSIAAWIAEVHHGSISLKKSDSTGSVFQVKLQGPEKK